MLREWILEVELEMVDAGHPQVVEGLIINPSTKHRAGFPGGSDNKESVCNAGDPSSTPGSGRFLWRRKWQPPLLLSGESRRSLAGYSPWGRKELDTTERLHFHCVHSPLLTTS